jgi:hypothetical protein
MKNHAPTVLFAVAMLISSMAVAPRSNAQNTTPEPDSIAILQNQVKTLQEQIAELQTKNEQAPQDQLDRLQSQINTLASEVESLRVNQAQPVTELTAEKGLAPAASKVYKSSGGVSLGGYGEMIYSHEDGAANDQFDFLRAIAYIGYKFNDSWVFNSEIEFEHASTGEDGEVSLEFAYLDYLFRPEINFRGGLLLMPMGFVNEQHEPTTFLGARRPELERAIIPSTWRENGAGVYGDYGPFQYRTYVVNGMDASGFEPGGIRGGRQDGSKAKAEDLAWVGRLDWQGIPGLTLGSSAYYGNSGQDMDSVSGSDLDVQTSILEGHAQYQWKGWEFRGLAAWAQLDDVDQLNLALELPENETVGEEMAGYYVQLGYDLLASRPNLGQGLIPFVRWEDFNTQDQVPSGFTADPSNDLEILTLGINYLPIPQLVLKADYQNVSNAASKDIDRINLGLGYVF